MGINTDKYHYINRVGLTKGSWALKQFLKDAEDNHMSDQPGKLAAMRLTEYYRMKEAMAGGLVALSPQASTSRPSQPSFTLDQEEEEEEESTTTATSNNALDDDEDSQWGL